MTFEDQSDTIANITATAEKDATQEAASVAIFVGGAEAATSSVDASASGGETTGELRNIMDELQALRREFQTKFLYDDAKQRQLDTMHVELQEHRLGMHYQLLRPVFTDLIALLDDMASVSVHLAREQEENGSASRADYLETFREQIEETLRRNGVEQYSNPSTTFERERQRAIGVVETADPVLDKYVAESVRPGYIYDGRIVVRAEQVKTYRYARPVDASTPHASE